MFYKRKYVLYKFRAIIKAKYTWPANVSGVCEIMAK